jgi:hypothetical protein
MPPFVVGLLSFLFPGLGQASAGERARGVLVALPMLAVIAAFAVLMYRDPTVLTGSTPDSRLLLSLLALDLLLGLYHLWASLDAYVLARRAQEEARWLDDAPPRLWLAVLSIGVLVIATLGVHTAAAQVALGWQHDLSCKVGDTACWFDISYPQCGSAYPATGQYGIVGVNHGKVFSVNPCLSDGDHPQLLWAGGLNAQLYANTGNPGPELSTRWPRNQATPRPCDTAKVPGADTADCAYDYGWNAAADAYQSAIDAYVNLGLAPARSTSTPAANMWWLDVETVNSWRDETELNVAMLKGATDFLESVKTGGIGFYSTQYQWNLITGGTTEFAAYPSWVAGASSAKHATTLCKAKGFTGGRVSLVQYHSGGFDADFLCPVA